MRGRLAALAYRTQMHRIGGWTVERSVLTLFWVIPAAILALWLLRGMPQVSWLHWLALALLVLVALILVALAIWSRRVQFTDFSVNTIVRPPDPLPLDPTAKILVHATGLFEVADKRHVFADLLAYWRTFSTREHAVMAIVHSTRFLRVAKTPEEHIGMWYIFFRPEAVDSIEPGTIRVGSKIREALCVRFWYKKPEDENKRRGRRNKPMLQTAFLSFDSTADQLLVWADLLVDEA